MKNQLNFRFASQLLAYYLIPAFLFSSVFWTVWNDGTVYKQVVSYGLNAYFLLCIILALKPLAVITKLRPLETLLTYRRELGVLAFWFAVFHGVTLLFYLEVFTVPLTVAERFGLPFLLSGFLGLVGILLLGLTSNKLATATLKGNWKKLHLLVFPTFVFVCVHKAQADDEPSHYLILALITLLKLTQYAITHKRHKQQPEKVQPPATSN